MLRGERTRTAYIFRCPTKGKCGVLELIWIRALYAYQKTNKKSSRENTHHDRNCDPICKGHKGQVPVPSLPFEGVRVDLLDFGVEHSKGGEESEHLLEHEQYPGAKAATTFRSACP